MSEDSFLHDERVVGDAGSFKVRLHGMGRMSSSSPCTMVSCISFCRDSCDLAILARAYDILVESNANYPRFIPNREGQDLQASFSLMHDEGSPATPSKQKKRTPHGELHFQKSM